MKIIRQFENLSLGIKKVFHTIPTGIYNTIQKQIQL